MIILASKSPRRKQLLSMMGLEFTVQTADIDETMDPDRRPSEEVGTRLRQCPRARQKKLPRCTRRT